MEPALPVLDRSTGLLEASSDIKLVTVDQLNGEEFDLFLRRHYGEVKGSFLRKHGQWLHRGNTNRFAILKEGEIAAYCGIIPTNCAIDGRRHPALWWVDLIVAPQFRGQGLQTILDRAVRKACDLKLGFPNTLAAGIHLKHGWGVRDDGRFFLLPLHPLRVRHVLRSQGRKGTVLQLAARMLSPAARAMRWKLAGYRPLSARVDRDPQADILAGAFFRYMNGNLLTTFRDEDYIRHRFLEAPYRSELTFYTAGPQHAPTHVLVARTSNSQWGTTTSILDVFGDFDNQEGLADIVRTARRDATLARSTQITVLSSVPQFSKVLRASGFLISSKMRFCWNSSSPDIMRDLGKQICHWSLADSDNDEPV
jgi:hypothetical protein